jgi:hypothetical protein
VLKKQARGFSESLSTNAELVAGRRRAGRRRGLPESRCFSAWKSSVNVPVVGVQPTDEAREMLKDCSIGVAAISVVARFIRWAPPSSGRVTVGAPSRGRHPKRAGPGTLRASRTPFLSIEVQACPAIDKRSERIAIILPRREHQEICMKQDASGKLIVWKTSDPL